MGSNTAKKAKNEGPKKRRRMEDGDDDVVEELKPERVCPPPAKKRLEKGISAAERCKRRLDKESKAKKLARDNRDLTLGEQVIRNPLIRDEILRHFNPWKLSELQDVVNLRSFYRLLPDIDMKECYFQKAWDFPENTEFDLANWADMTLEEMRERVKDAHPDAHPDANLPWYRASKPLFPSCKAPIYSLKTKAELANEYWELTCVPSIIYRTAFKGMIVLQRAKSGDFGHYPGRFGSFLEDACRAGLDAPLIRRLAGAYEKGSKKIHEAALNACLGGHDRIVDLLASEYGLLVDNECLQYAVMSGHCKLIDHLVRTYDLDPNEPTDGGSTALHRAARDGRSQTVRHLITVHDADVNRMTPGGATALDIAEEAGHTACIDVLREHGATNGFGTDMEWWNEIMEEDEAEDEADEAEEDGDEDEDDDDEEWETCSQEEWSSGDDSE